MTDAKTLKQAIEHHIKIEAVIHVYLRIEENLRPPNAIGIRPCQIGEHEVGEILLGAQHGHELVVQVQERLKILKLIVCLEIVKISERQADVVTFGQFQGQFRLEGAFDMQMKLRLRQLTQCLFGGRADVSHANPFMWCDGGPSANRK